MSAPPPDRLLDRLVRRLTGGRGGRPGDRPGERAGKPGDGTEPYALRREGVRLRAQLNACTVLLNLAWSEAWASGEFRLTDLPDERLAELGHRVSWLEDVRPAAAPVRSLRAQMQPTIDLLRLGTDELVLTAGSRYPQERVPELRASEQRLAAMVHDRPGRAFAAACIRARRYVLLASPGGLSFGDDLFLRYPEGDDPGELSDLGRLASESRTQAVAGLAAAAHGDPALRAWAAQDPAFVHLLDEREFQLAVRGPGDGVRLPFREPWVRG